MCVTVCDPVYCVCACTQSADDPALQAEWRAVKVQAKARAARLIESLTGAALCTPGGWGACTWGVSVHLCVGVGVRVCAFMCVWGGGGGWGARVLACVCVCVCEPCCALAATRR